jgi:hypothetical protein
MEIYTIIGFFKLILPGLNDVDGSIGFGLDVVTG